MNLVYFPPWSTRLIASIALGLVLLAVVRWWCERRGGLLVVLRAVIIGMLVFVMLNPQSICPVSAQGNRS